MQIPGRDALYDVMRRWVDDCLVGDGSLLAPGARVWSEENLAALKTWFIDDPHIDKDVSFEEKLAARGEGATRDAKLLFAEVRTIQLMPMAEVSQENKRKEISSIFDVLGVEVPFPDDVDEAFAHGLATYGMAKVHKYWHLCLIIDRALAFKRLDAPEQQRLLDEPFGWKRFVQSNAFKRVGSQENMLLHVAHPDRFEPIPSGADKMKIARALDAYAGGESDVDAALHRIHTYFNERSGGWVSLYNDDIRPLWDEDAKAAATDTDADEQEALWQQQWAAWLVERYRGLGGQPTIPDDPELPTRIQAALAELSRTADVDAWLRYLKTDERQALRNLWMGAHARTHRAIVDEATDRAAAARALADALRAPATDEEATAKIHQLRELHQGVSWGVWASLLGPMLWHFQDSSISPVGLGVDGRLIARGWFEPYDDEAEFFLRHTERMTSFGQDVRWLFIALAQLEQDGPLGLDALPPVTFERCAAAATVGTAALRPVLADLELLALAVRRHLRLGDDASTARSTTKGPGVWVDIRHGDATLLRLWAGPDGLFILRPRLDDETAPDGLELVGEQDALPHIDGTGGRWVGVLLPPEEAARAAAIEAAAELLVPTGLEVSDELASLFEEFRSGYDATNLARVEAERMELAEHLSSTALAAPDLDGLRQIINTPRYGSPGPMSHLNTSFTTANANGRLDEVGLVFDALCNGDGELAARIDEALASEVSGLGPSIAMKLLAITHPSRVLPVFPLKGPMGKLAMLYVLGLEPPVKYGSEGERQMAANDALLEVTRGLTTDLWEAKDFLYWLLDRERPSEIEDDEDRLAQVVQDSYVPRQWVDEVVELLKDKKQIVMYGPPGTGKTWIALQLAKALAPGEGRSQLVQFHPAYSYEDFFEGFRPRERNGVLTYELTPGPLKTFADAAAADPRRTYILIIDEINRANLPKVFGELLFLLEYRSEHAQTMYGGEPFQLPENLWIIATMNTADRSIALVDAALRRRFHFVPMFPDREPLTGTLRKWLKAKGEKPWIAELLEHVNEELVRKLGGPHLQIGPSHFMKEGITESVNRVWRYTIEPLIEEQLFGDDAAIESLRWAAVSKKIAPTAVAVSLPSDGVDELPAEALDDEPGDDGTSSDGPNLTVAAE